MKCVTQITLPRQKGHWAKRMNIHQAVFRYISAADNIQTVLSEFVRIKRAIRME
jgi:hypothetical protein